MFEMRWFLNTLLLLYLAAASYTDIKNRTVSVRAALSVGFLTLIMQLVFASARPPAWPAGILPGLFLLVLSLVTRQEIGSGDGCVLLIIGLNAGFAASVGILLGALLLLSPAALFLLVFRKAGRRTSLPFVPFLFAGYLLFLIL